MFWSYEDVDETTRNVYYGDHDGPDVDLVAIANKAEGVWCVSHLFVWLDAIGTKELGEMLAQMEEEEEL